MGPMPRHLSALLASVLVLATACSRDLPTTANTSAAPRDTYAAVLPPAQGPCGPLTQAPFTTPAGQQVGTFYTWYDDANVYGAFQAEPGVTIPRTSLGLYAEDQEIPTNPDGSVAIKRLSLQSRNAPPVAQLRQRMVMDTVEEMLGHYRAEPHAVLQLSDGTLFELWAGQRIPRPFPDSIARQIVVTVQSTCLPRVIVLSDRNMLDNGGFQGNDEFADQLFWKHEQPRFMFPPPLPRHRGQVMFDRGRNSPCWQDGSCSDTAIAALRTMYSSGIGIPVSDIFSTQGSLTSIPPEFGLLFLWLPREIYTVEEINTLKQYVAEGGRIVYIAEESGYYDAAGRATLDHFLADMGSAARTQVGAFDCGGYRDLPKMEYPLHRLTEWPPTVRVRCTGALTTGFLDFNLFHDATNKVVTGASVAVDTLPIVAHALVIPER
jgi:hypothetical protein